MERIEAEQHKTQNMAGLGASLGRCAVFSPLQFALPQCLAQHGVSRAIPASCLDTLRHTFDKFRYLLIAVLPERVATCVLAALVGVGLNQSANAAVVAVHARTIERCPPRCITQ